MPDETQPQGDEAQSNDNFDFDTWLGAQPEHVRKGYEGKTQGLHSALEKERTGRQDSLKELKRLSGLVEEGSEAKKALDGMSSRAELAERMADFYKDAGKSEIGCLNPETAFLVAQAKDLFKRSGEPDWAAIKAAAPELFATRKAPPGNAGSGNGSPPAEKVGMNDWIRRTARGG